MMRATLVGCLLGACIAPSAVEAQSRPAVGIDVPVDYRTLPNGLRVVLSRDTTAPTAVVGVYYRIGFRIEPRNRTGFAHLFEHLMFQGSQNLGKMQFINLVQNNGGQLNGSTRFDFTNYFEVVPSHVLRTVLWAEADRMRGLAIDGAMLQNQKDVVKNEVKVNVLNQPYGSFPWIDMPMTANTNWFNAHNFYGELGDLDAATLDEAGSFFRTYYAPNNAVLVVTGDFAPAETWAWIEQYFGTIPAVPQPAPVDIAEPRQTAERRGSRSAPQAPKPAFAVGYHVPERFTPEWYAFGLIDQLLVQGRDARLFDQLVRRRAVTSDASGGINWGLGSMFDYQGPMLWYFSVYHDASTPSETIIGWAEEEMARLRDEPVDAATLERAKIKLRSALYDELEQFSGFGRANLLAAFALFDNDPARINRLEPEFAKVTPALVQRTAREYLRPTARTVYTIIPGAGQTAGAGN